MLSNKSALTEDLFDELTKLRKKLMAESHVFFSQCNIRPAQGHILQIVGGHNNIGIKEISQIMGVSKSAATQLVDELVIQNLVTKVPSKEDGRAINLSLTGEALEKIKLVKKYKLKKINDLLSSLSEEEIELFIRICQKINQ